MLSLKVFKSIGEILGYRFLVLIIILISSSFLDGIGISILISTLEQVLLNSEVNTSSVIELFDFQIPIKVVIAFIFTTFLLKGVIKYLEIYYQSYIQQFYIKFLRTQLLDSIVNMSYADYLNESKGDIINISTIELNRIVQAFRRFAQITSSLIMGLVYLMIAAFTSYKYVAILVLMFLLPLLINKIFFNISKENGKLSVAVNARYQENFLAFIEGFLNIVVTDRKNIYSERILVNIDTSEEINLNQGKNEGRLTSIRDVLNIYIIILSIFSSLIYFNISGSSILIATALIFRSQQYFSQLVLSYNQFLNFMPSYYVFNDIIGRLNRRSLGKNTNAELNESEISKAHFDYIVIENLSFAYDKKCIISNLSFKIKKGEKIVITGSSGNGKSTLLNLLSGLLEPSAGSIYFTSVNGELVLPSLMRKNFGYIDQNYSLFDDTILNNITLWTNIDEESLESLYNLMAIFNLSIDLNQKINTLSGGQKQRIVWLRELYQKPDVLFIDEGTSALDDKTSKDILNYLISIKDLTVLFVTHDSKIKNYFKSNIIL